MTTALRVGIVGAGLIAGVHARAYATVPGVSIVGVADPRETKAQALASTVGARAFDGLEAVLDAGVDVISVCTPPDTHAELAVAAIKSGAHVLCEKPLAGTLEDARRIVAAAHTTQAVVCVGHVSRFEPDHQRAKELVDEGRLGRLAMLCHSMTTSLPGWSEGGWLTDPRRSGGPLLDLAVHSFDYLSWVNGSAPTRVYAIGADSPAGPATYALATLAYANGAMGQIEVSWAHPAERGFKVAVELAGTLGRLAWDYDSINGGAMYSRQTGQTLLDPLGERGFAREVTAFVHAVRAGGPSPVPVEAAFQSTRTALAAQHSLDTGEPVDLTTWEVA
ncbi:Gfo/Idh/MocA family protein [Actinopolymorpha singaporensis]